MNMKEILYDVYDEVGEERTIEAEVETNSRGIFIKLKGYGDACGGQEIVLVELADGDPQVVIWGNNGQEDPTHIISLRRAKEE